jgi:hypothetical protein
MATKIFAESDSWGDFSGNILSFSTKKKQKEKKVKAKKRNHSEIEGESVGGAWIRYFFKIKL